MPVQSKTPPILNRQNKVVFNKIILIYAIFYVVLKAYVIVFKDQWLLENLLISIPIIFIGVLAYYFQKTKKQNWYSIFVSIATATLLRLYESEWIVQIHQFLN